MCVVHKLEKCFAVHFSVNILQVVSQRQDIQYENIKSACLDNEVCCLTTLMLLSVVTASGFKNVFICVCVVYDFFSLFTYLHV